MCLHFKILCPFLNNRKCFCFSKFLNHWISNLDWNRFLEVFDFWDWWKSAAREHNTATKLKRRWTENDSWLHGSQVRAERTFWGWPISKVRKQHKRAWRFTNVWDVNGWFHTNFIQSMIAYLKEFAAQWRISKTRAPFY